MESLEVDVDVNEEFVARLRVSQRAVITLDSYKQVRYPGRLVAIIPSADRSKGTIKVRVQFDRKDSRIVPEMGAQVMFLSFDVPDADQQKKAWDAK
jgi:multidrug efflux pump subunit AcrA (membrane-fusion protein)